jgi:hypothetical protein
MRSRIRCLDAIWPGAILLAGLGIMASERTLLAQIASPNPQAPAQMPTAPTMPGSGRQNGPGSDESNNPMMRQLAEQQASKRNDMRQKVIVDDTARLLTLAQQLKQEADKGSKPSSASARKAEEIEKLAKTVKDKMREGQ